MKTRVMMYGVPTDCKVWHELTESLNQYGTIDALKFPQHCPRPRDVGRFLRETHVAEVLRGQDE
jgi:hypothetical protein